MDSNMMNTIHLNIKNRLPKILTPIIESTNQNTFVGRSKEVEVIDKFFGISNALVLVSSISGVGKSSLASHYLELHREEFDYYGYVKINDSFRQSFTSSFKVSLGLTQDRLDDLFIEAITKLSHLEGKKFLIIDNSQGIELPSNKLNLVLNLINKDFKILFISNSKIKDIRDYEIGALSVDDASALFINYYPTDKIEKVKKIVSYCGYHTFFLKLLAKRVKSSNYNLDDIIKLFDNRELIPLQDGDINMIINTNIQKLLFMQKLDIEYITLLKRLSALPSIEIKADFIEELFQDRVEDKLNLLVSWGWISRRGDSYKLHHILKNYILNYNHATFNDIASIVEYFNRLIANSNLADAIINAKKNLLYLKSLNIILQTFNIKHTTITTFYQNLSNIYYHLGEYDKALKILHKLIKTDDKNSIQIAKNYNNLGLLYKSKKDYGKALMFLKKALILRIELLGDYHINTARSYNNVGLVYRLNGHYDEAIKHFNKGLLIEESISGKNSINISYIYNNLALTYQEILDYKNAQLFFQKTIKIKEKYLGKNHLDTAMAYSNLAILYRDIKKYSRALSLLKKSIEIYSNILGETHQKSVSNYNKMALIYKDMNSNQLAMDYIKKVLKIKLSTLGEYHPKTALAYNNLGLMYLSKDDYGGARQLFKKALSISKNILGEDNLDTAYIRYNLAITHFLMKDYQYSRPIFTKTLETYEKILGLSHPKTIRIKNSLAVIYAQLLRDDKAMEIYYESIIISQDKDLNTALSYHNIATILFNKEEYQEAYENMLECVEIRSKLLRKNDLYLINAKDKLNIIKDILNKLQSNKKVDDFLKFKLDFFVSDKSLDNLFITK